MESSSSDTAPAATDRGESWRIRGHHPFALARVSGLAFNVLEPLRSSRTLEASAQVRRLEDEASARKADLERALHTDVGASSSAEARGALLAASRNLRRNGKISAEQEKAVQGLGSASARSALVAWRDAEGMMAVAVQAQEGVYERERAQGRQALRAISQEPAFQSGLLAASAPLYGNVVAYLRTPPESLHENRQSRLIELVLLRYIARAAAKTSPFSTFTATALVRAADLAGRESFRFPEDGRVWSSVALNKVLYALIGSLVRRTPPLYPCFSVTLNPTLHATEAGHAMLVAAGGRERIVRLPASPALERCLRVITQAGGTLGYSECCALLAADFGQDPSRFSSRLDRMIEAGLLQFNSGISDQERQWAPILARALGRSEHPLAVQLTGALRELEAIRSRLEEAAPPARADLLERAGACLDALLESGVTGAARPADGGVLDSQARAVKRNPFYEDTALAGPILLDPRRLQPTLDALYHWVDGMSLMALQWGYHATMREYFRRRYAGRPRVRFLEFYVGFYEEVFEAIVEQGRGAAGKSFTDAANPYGIEVFQRTMEASDRFYSHLNQIWAADPGAEELQVRRSDLWREGLEGFRPDGPCSAMVFAHLLPGAGDGQQDRLVVDRSLVQRGMGRYYSRFLHLFDAEFTESLRRRNRVPGYLVAELGDDSEFSFNANLHPVLTDREINYPSAFTGLQRDSNLPLADLDVEPHLHLPHRLRLVHRPTATEVCPVDLGFLSHLLRPPLFRVLLLFSPLYHHQTVFPSHNRLLPAPGDGSVVRRPRIVYEDRLVLARESWLLPADAFREQAGRGSPAQAFRRLDSWRRSLGMPADVFFKLAAESPAKDAPADPAREAAPRSQRRNVSKPQYVSFDSVLLVESLIDAVRRHSGGIVFEEMLPRPGMLPRWRSSPHMTELVFQVDGER